jgi:hypothetical protein
LKILIKILGISVIGGTLTALERLVREDTEDLDTEDLPVLDVADDIGDERGGKP